MPRLWATKMLMGIAMSANIAELEARRAASKMGGGQ
jgi:hypothetical protein